MRDPSATEEARIAALDRERLGGEGAAVAGASGGGGGLPPRPEGAGGGVLPRWRRWWGGARTGATADGAAEKAL